MAIRKVIKMGDQRLLETSEQVENYGTSELDGIIRDLIDTKNHEGGIGLAAPQIGIAKRIIFIGMKNNPRYPNDKNIPEQILINPTYQSVDNKTDYFLERCISIPGMRGKVKRFINISFSAYDFHGNLITGNTDGLLARAIQHETDHLDGILYTMRADIKDFGFDDEISERFNSR